MTNFLNVLMEERNEREAVGFFGNWAKWSIEQKKLAYDWRYENSISNGKEIDVDTDYSQWRTNNVLANHTDTIFYINEMNLCSVTNQMHYDYLHSSIRKKKRWSKVETKEEKRAREEKESLQSLVSQYYKYNATRTKEALRILTTEQIEFIRNKNNKGGVK